MVARPSGSEGLGDPSIVGAPTPEKSSDMDGPAPDSPPRLDIGMPLAEAGEDRRGAAPRDTGPRDTGPRNATAAVEIAVWGYREDLERLATYLCRHREDAEDVTQSALLAGASHLGDFRGEAALRTWLHRIVANECRMLHRRAAPESLDDLLDTMLADSQLPQLEGHLASTGVDPEQAVLEAERRRQVLVALAELPELDRAVLVLKDGQGLKAEAIGEMTGMSEAAVRARLHRGRRRLRSMLANGANGANGARVPEAGPGAGGRSAKPSRHSS